MSFVTKLLLWIFVLSIATFLCIAMFGNLQESALAKIAGLGMGCSFWGLILKVIVDSPISVRMD